MKTLDIDLEIVNRGIPVSAQNTYRRALAGSRPSAVKAACLECQGWEDGARQAIRDCPSVGCPLHAVRPFQRKAGNAAVEIETEEDDLDQCLTQATENVNSAVDILALDLAASKAKILDHLHRHGESARGYILFSTNIPESLWAEAIRSLLADNAIEREGEKRSTRYRLKESK